VRAKPALALPDTIDHVLERLQQLTAEFRREGSRLGYFSILYYNVTVEVRRGIAMGRFEDPARMDRLDVTFANRYLTALEAHRLGERGSRCWGTCLRAASEWPPLVLQHLLLGMNAHINYDLAIAAAVTCPGGDLAGFRHDFDEMNNILAAMVNGVQYRLSLVSPWMTLLDRLGGRLDEAVMQFSIERARAAAWSAAERLAALPAERWGPELDLLDQRAATIANRIRRPGRLLQVASLFVRLTEPRHVGAIIDDLS